MSGCTGVARRQQGGGWGSGGGYKCWSTFSWVGGGGVVFFCDGLEPLGGSVAVGDGRRLSRLVGWLVGRRAGVGLPTPARLRRCRVVVVVCLFALHHVVLQ